MNALLKLEKRAKIAGAEYRRILTAIEVLKETLAPEHARKVAKAVNGAIVAHTEGLESVVGITVHKKKPTKKKKAPWTEERRTKFFASLRKKGLKRRKPVEAAKE